MRTDLCRTSPTRLNLGNERSELKVLRSLGHGALRLPNSATWLVKNSDEKFRQVYEISDTHQPPLDKTFGQRWGCVDHDRITPSLVNGMERA